MIDVIIPAYNSKKTIEYTLMSLCIQSIKDMIVVTIIDDASDDDYQDTINKFNKYLVINYKRNNKNMGAGISRQIGLDITKNEYIFFLDSDDLLYSCDSLEKLYKKIIKGYDYVYSNCYNEATLDISFNKSDLHGKMYKRKFLDDNKIVFNDSRYHEDNSFNNIVLLNKPNQDVITDITYIYCYNPSSLTNYDISTEWEKLEMYIYNMRYVVDYANAHNLDAKTYVDNKYNYLFNYLKKLDLKKINIINEWLKKYNFDEIVLN